MMLTVVITEDLKRKPVVNIRARDGMPKHLMPMFLLQTDITMQVWITTIIAETQMVVTQFGATQQIQLKDGNIVTQCMLF